MRCKNKVADEWRKEPTKEDEKKVLEAKTWIDEREDWNVSFFLWFQSRTTNDGWINFDCKIRQPVLLLLLLNLGWSQVFLICVWVFETASLLSSNPTVELLLMQGVREEARSEGKKRWERRNFWDCVSWSGNFFLFLSLPFSPFFQCKKVFAPSQAGLERRTTQQTFRTMFIPLCLSCPSFTSLNSRLISRWRKAH